jgi:hypothetical protein
LICRRRRRSIKYTPYLYDDYEEPSPKDSYAITSGDQQLVIEVVFKLIGNFKLTH